MPAESALRTLPKSRLSRGAYAALGCLFVGMGIVGIFIPVWPTTIFCIVALWCFKKSSKRLEHWLLNHRWIGPTLRDWDESRCLSLRAKWISISAIWASIVLSSFVVRREWVVCLLVATAAALTLYLGTRPTKAIERREAAEAA